MEVSLNCGFTSRRKRGLSGMNMRPMRAAMAGSAHTNTNTLQLCSCISEPMLKPHPGRQGHSWVSPRGTSPPHLPPCQDVLPGTVVRDNAPGRERGIHAPHHPEHTEPAQMLPSLLHGEELGKVGVDDGDRAADAAGNRGHLTA